MKRVALSLPVGSLLLACGGTAVAPTDAPPPSTASARPVASSPAAVAPTATTVTTAPPAKSKSPFFVLAKTDFDLTFYPVDDALFVQGGPMLTRVDGDKLVRDERFATGLPSFYGMVGMQGRFPDDLHLLITGTDGRVGWGESYVWSRDHWNVAGAALERTWVFVGFSRWDKGQLLAMSAWGLAFQPGARARFKVVSGASSSATNLVFSSQAKPCKDGILPDAMTATTDGAVVAVGDACDAPILEYWQPGQTKSTVLPMDARADFVTFAGKTSRDLYVASTAQKSVSLRHFDGTAWTNDTLPQGVRAIRSMSLAKDGTLWAVSGNHYELGNGEQRRLYRRARGGTWEEIEMPADALGAPSDGKTPGVSDVYVDDAGDVWASAGGALLRTRPGASEAVHVDWPAYTQFASSSLRMPRAATKTCESLFALFYGFTKVTPDDYDFPLTRKALTGQTQFADARFVVTTDNGHKFFGAFPKTYDEGVKMVERVKKEVSGSSPQLLCATPTVVREVKLDLRTGEVAK